MAKLDRAGYVSTPISEACSGRKRGPLLCDRSGGAKGGTQFVESTLADGAGRVAEDQEDDGRQGHNTEDGPEPVRSMRGQVVVGIGLRIFKAVDEVSAWDQAKPCRFSSVNQRGYAPGSAREHCCA